jgi:hypothetical protein
MAFYLPTRIPSYLRRLAAEYARAKPLHHEVVVSSRSLAVPETAYDSIDGGQYGHSVRLYVPLPILTKIGIDGLEAVEDDIRNDLQKLARNVDHESFDRVQIDEADESDPEFQKAIPFSTRPQIDPDRLSIWKPGLMRVFISHRDRHKAKAQELADALESYGFSCFVAHSTIEANEEWHKVIMNGLETMEVMLAFLTDDFHESSFTMQEIGFALGKGIPWVSLKLESRDPPGFISHRQALRGTLERPARSAVDLYPLLASAVGRKDRMQSAVVAAFIDSRNFSDARDRFAAMNSVIEKLTDDELASIITGFSKNDQLYNAGVLRGGRLTGFLNAATGRQFVIGGKVISEL